MSTSPRTLTFTEAAREGLAEEMERDDSIFVVGEASAKGVATSTPPWACSTDSVPVGFATLPLLKEAL